MEMIQQCRNPIQSSPKTARLFRRFGIAQMVDAQTKILPQLTVQREPLDLAG